MGKHPQESSTDGTFRTIEDEKSNHETKFYNEPQQTKSSENPPVYDEPPIDSTVGNLVAPVMVQPPASYITVQPVVQPVIAPVNSHTSMCECDDIWCSFCWLRRDFKIVNWIRNPILSLLSFRISKLKTN